MDQGQINEVYERHESIAPRYTGQAGLKIMEILKLLPMTNCKACGYETCMAYAAACAKVKFASTIVLPYWRRISARSGKNFKSI
jgi:ArsR family metal-binding transcriptional regulator